MGHKATAIAPKISAPFSILGSSLIVLDIVRSRKKLGRTYSRLMLGMSVIDIAFSIAAFFSTWPIPQESGRPFASGTTATCTAQGFFIQLGVGGPMYNASLSLFYLFLIVFSISDVHMKRIEWFLHLFPLGFSIGFALAGLPLTLYNNAYLWCWIASEPGYCENGTNQGGEGPCERGYYAWIYRWALYYGLLGFCVLLVSVNMLAVVYVVWAKQRASRRFQFGRGSTDRKSESRSISSWFSKIRLSKKTREHTQGKRRGTPGLASQVAWQAFFYVGSFYLAWLPTTVLRTLQASGKPVPYWVLVAMAILTPLQGLLNFMVYIRPRVLKYQRDNPDMTAWASLIWAINRTLKMCRCSYLDEEEDAADARTMDPSQALPTEEEDPAHVLQVRNDVHIHTGTKANEDNPPNVKDYQDEQI